MTPTPLYPTPIYMTQTRPLVSIEEFSLRGVRRSPRDISYHTLQSAQLTVAWRRRTPTLDVERETLAARTAPL